MARPTDFNQSIADVICERIADGTSLRKICLDDDMPCKASVFTWLNKYPEFSDQYARAREEQAESLADEIIDISDESYNDHDIDDNGNVRVNNEAIQRSKLRVEARKWVASKLKPKRYGDKLTQELTGANGGAIKIDAMQAILDEIGTRSAIPVAK